ncbi:hypothetical protein Acr_24g0007620 [Actinidia rufa]|uniref:Uncharacterized protein n=1 Tax=Actinidia rufa TaxID=165716 RepID=A0A7J0GUW7_9ERIC|nr:hypothetical protein Acr_24g0007620 [Actinidia rufa]
MDTPYELQSGLGLATGLGLIQLPHKTTRQHPRYLTSSTGYSTFHRSVCTSTPKCLAPPTGVCRKRLASGAPRPSLYSFSKSTWSPSSELIYGHPALVAPLVSGQTSVHIPKHLPALLYHSGSSKYHYGSPKYPCSCFAYFCATVAFLVHSSRNTTGPMSDSSSSCLDTPLQSVYPSSLLSPQHLFISLENSENSSTSLKAASL